MKTYQGAYVFADWIPKATDTESEYVIRFALPW